jgi:hypothetical protein
MQNGLWLTVCDDPMPCGAVKRRLRQRRAAEKKQQAERGLRNTSSPRQHALARRII